MPAVAVAVSMAPGLFGGGGGGVGGGGVLREVGGARVLNLRGVYDVLAVMCQLDVSLEMRKDNNLYLLTCLGFGIFRFTVERDATRKLCRKVLLTSLVLAQLDKGHSKSSILAE